MSEAKKAIIRGLGFGGLIHIPPMNVPHKLLKELANSFNLDKNKLDTRHGSLKIKPKKIEAALGLNASGDLFSDKLSFMELSEENKEIFRRFQGKTLKNLTNQMMDIGIDNDQDCLMFKRIFIFYIQMAFLLPTTINKVSPVHLAPIFRMNITEYNWGSHVLNFIIKGIINYHKKGEGISGLPWVSHWNRELLVARIRAEIDGNMGIVKKAEVKKKLKEMKEKEKKEKKKEKTKKNNELAFSSEFESEEDSEEATKRRKQPTKTTKKVFFANDCLLSRMVSRKRKQILEDSTSESESESDDEMQSKKIKHIVEDSSSEEQIESYDVMKEAGLPSTEGHYDSSEMCILTLFGWISGWVWKKNRTPQPQQPAESTPTVPPTPSKILSFTDSSKEETLTQEGQPGSEKGKSPKTPILIEELEELVEKIANTEVKAALNFAKDKVPRSKSSLPTKFLKSLKLLQGGRNCWST
ncbi:uncharacterized protein DS421_18g629650 [Arachis hypogaea]|nr:uncharacterized protein DS421_18g629650 [Arachis hypogaea]